MNAKSTLNSKYQVVIPKEVRAITSFAKPGAKVSVVAIDQNTIQLSLDQSTDWVNSVTGLAKGMYGKDSTEWLKKQRQEWK